MATIQEAADYLNVSVEYVQKLIDNKELNIFYGYVYLLDLRKLKDKMAEKSKAAMDEIVRLGQEMDCY